MENGRKWKSKNTKRKKQIPKQFQTQYKLIMNNDNISNIIYIIDCISNDVYVYDIHAYNVYNVYNVYYVYNL